jgi:hypothetical protein
MLTWVRKHWRKWQPDPSLPRTVAQLQAQMASLEARLPPMTTPNGHEPSPPRATPVADHPDAHLGLH